FVGAKHNIRKEGNEHATLTLYRTNNFYCLTLHCDLHYNHCTVFSLLSFFILPHASIVTAPSSQLEREIAKQDRRTKVKDLDEHRTEAAEKLPHRPGEATAPPWRS